MVEKIITSFLEHSLELVLLFIAGYLATLRNRFVAWLKSRTTLQQQEILHRLAGEASALAESAYIEGDGPAKLRAAMGYVFERLGDNGIKIPVESVRAAVEKAVLDYNAKVKGGDAGANTGPSTSDIGKSS